MSHFGNVLRKRNVEIFLWELCLIFYFCVGKDYLKKLGVWDVVCTMPNDSKMFKERIPRKDLIHHHLPFN